MALSTKTYKRDIIPLTGGEAIVLDLIDELDAGDRERIRIAGDALRDELIEASKGIRLVQLGPVANVYVPQDSVVLDADPPHVWSRRPTYIAIASGAADAARRLHKRLRGEEFGKLLEKVDRVFYDGLDVELKKAMIISTEDGDPVWVEVTHATATEEEAIAALHAQGWADAGTPDDEERTIYKATHKVWLVPGLEQADDAMEFLPTFELLREAEKRDDVHDESIRWWEPGKSNRELLRGCETGRWWWHMEVEYS